jgi:hypothetical protein
VAFSFLKNFSKISRQPFEDEIASERGAGTLSTTQHPSVPLDFGEIPQRIEMVLRGRMRGKSLLFFGDGAITASQSDFQGRDNWPLATTAVSRTTRSAA